MTPLKIVSFVVVSMACLLTVSGHGKAKGKRDEIDWNDRINQVQEAWGKPEFANFYAPDAIFTQKNHDVSNGADEIKEAFQGLFETRTTLKMEPFLVGNNKDIGVAITRNRYFDENDNKVDSLTQMDILSRNENDEWQIQETYEFQTNLVPFPRLMADQQTEQQTDQQTEQQTEQQADQQEDQQTEQQTEQQTDQESIQKTSQQTNLVPFPRLHWFP